MADGKSKTSKSKAQPAPKEASKGAAAAPKAPKPAKAAAPPSDSKFGQFIASKKLDPRRILAASHQLEKLNPEDRNIKWKKRAGRKAEGDAAGPKETRKPRSGRPVTPRALDAALKGGKMSGPTKTRLLKAINHLLAQKKQEAVELRTLF